jgi:hypothetical protein
MFSEPGWTPAKYKYIIQEESKNMKIYALKFKDEIIRFSNSEYEVSADYRWERPETRKHLTVIYGIFTEEGIIERLEEIKEEKKD